MYNAYKNYNNQIFAAGNYTSAISICNNNKLNRFGVKSVDTYRCN